MIRELKSFTQLRALVLAELGKHAEFKQITPEVSSLREPDKTGCNWEVSQWAGPRDLVQEATPKLTALVAMLQRRYKAIAPATRLAPDAQGLARQPDRQAYPHR